MLNNNHYESRLVVLFKSVEMDYINFNICINWYHFVLTRYNGIGSLLAVYMK